MRTTKLQRALAALVAITVAIGVVLATPSTAAAGCLREWDDCGECAINAMAESFKNRDFGGFQDAYVDMLDCDIDLIHCIIYAQHHQYSCEA